jgi:hypothetical protein
VRYAAISTLPPMTAPPKMVELDKPRALTDGERGLLEFLADGDDLLGEQVRNATVVARCDCGCPSIGLASAGPAIADASVAQREPQGHDDYFFVKASGANRAGVQVDVILHVGRGLINELEIWAGTWGDPPETDLPALPGLRRSD